MLGDGAYLPITHVGSATISSAAGTVTLNEVLVCPDIKKSLLSVSKLCEDYHCGVFFDAKQVYLIDLEKGKVVTKGPRSKGLYMLKSSEFEVYFSDRQKAASQAVWHLRLGHSNSRVLQQLQTSKEIQVNKSRSNPVCQPCQMGKSSRLQFFQSSSHVASPLHRIHCDLWGPSPVSSSQGFRFYAVFIDDCTRFSWLYPLHNKAEFYGVFTEYVKLVENQFESTIKEFQSDGGGEFVNHRMKKFLSDKGILHRISCPYTPEQNGLAERKHRHCVELGLSMMFQCHLPLHLWVEAFSTANHIINLLPSVVLENISPFEKLYKSKPDYEVLRVVGSACFPCLRPIQAHKFEPKSLQCVFMGYSNQYKGYRCLYPPTGKIYISRHVIFDEEVFPFKDNYKHLVPKYETSLLRAWQLATTSVEVPSETEQITRFLTAPPTNQVQMEAPEAPIIPSDNEEEALHPPIQVAVEPPEENAQMGNQHKMQTRSKAVVHKPNMRYALVASKKPTGLPKNIAEAMKHPGWNRAVSTEMENIHMLQTWSLVPPTADMNIITIRWVYTEKLNPDGTVKRLRARLVGKGFEQEEGHDYLETFSPVVRTATIRLMLQIAVSRSWPIRQLDVTSAFLHGDLQEPVYMYQPEGFVDPDRPQYVCKLTKALYGLKQAPRAWFDTFSSYIIDYGFKCSKSDPSMFTYHKCDKSMVLLLYVDDMLLTDSDERLLQQLIDSLSVRFSMKDMGVPEYFLGIEMVTHQKGIFLHQKAYTEDILRQAQMFDCSPMPTPLPQRVENLDPSSFPEPTYFRSLASKLQYLTITRPDIQFAANFICQRMHSPTVSDFGLLKRIMRYLKGTSELGLHIKKDLTMSLLAFCDSDWAGCQDTRRSTTGFCTFLGPNLVSWSAKRQETVSRSSTEAEYKALAATAQEITWLSQLLRDRRITQSDATLLLCDNLSAVYLSTNPALHKRSKHFDTDYHYIREQVALGLIETRHIPASLQVADIFTKSLPRQSYVDLRSKLGVAGPPTTSLRWDVRHAHNTMAQEEPKTHLPHLPSSKVLLSCCRAEERSTKSLIRNRYTPLQSLCAG